MEYISVGEKTFVKANKIARELGYTADYIGQLCRADKVEAKLIGRSWYVEESSIRSHKHNRYRSTKATTQKELQQAISERKPERAAAPTQVERAIHQAPLPSGRFYRHQSATLIAPRYAQDDAELLPVLKKPAPAKLPKPRILSVSLADAETISVENKEKESRFSPTELPEVRFKGRLKVASADDIEEPTEVSEPTNVPAIDEEKKAPKPEVVPVVTKPEAHNIDVISDDKKRGEKIPVAVIETKPPVRSKKSTQFKVAVVEDEGDTVEPVAVHEVAVVEAVESEVTSILLPVLMFIVVGGLSALLGLCILSIQAVVEVDQELVTTSYEFDIWLGIQQLKLYLYSYLG
jgi:hypothetical protein